MKNRERGRAALATLASVFVVVAAAGAAALAAPRAPHRAAPEPSGAPAVTVTAVHGPSWLHHLRLSVSRSKMGEMGGSGPAPESERREPAPGAGSSQGFNQLMRRFLSMFNSKPEEAERAFHQPFELTGADLYRLNCQSCHGPDGKGAPPEINSVLDPVRGTSVAEIERRMAARGRSIPEDMARDLAAQAEKSIRDRLRNGGEKMPPFPHLRGDEVEALLAYLDRLAGVPGGGKPEKLVPQSAARVGEHVVKGTCQICHDATGPGGHRMAMMGGVIPSLESFPRQYSLDSVIHQVQLGSSAMSGMMGRGMMGGGMMGRKGGETMPALPYFTEEEIAAAYFYLKEYPPGR